MVSIGIAPLGEPYGFADRVYDSLRDAILSLEMEPGSPVVERDLALRFQVSKSPVRDALNRLVGEGLLVPSARRSLRVLKVDRQLADEIYELREQLERMAIRLATPRLTADLISAAYDVLEKVERAINQGDAVEATKLNREFHSIFSDNSGNRALATALERLQDRVRLIALMGWRVHGSMRDEHDEHVAILRAAEAGNARLAGKLMFNHVHEARMRLRNEIPE